MSTFTASIVPQRGTPAAAQNPWPTPLDEPAFHGLLGDIVIALMPHTESDPAALLLQILAMFGSVIGRTAHFRVEADTHYLNLFVGLVGNTAKARKGLSRGRSQRVVAPVDPDWARRCISSGLSSGEGLIFHVRDEISKQEPIKQRGKVIDYQLVVEDPGIADKRLLVIESELASVLKVMAREGSTLSPVIRQAWDGHDLRTLTRNHSLRATAPHIALVGHITRDELRRYLEATECANGFGNRFLWACVEQSKELPDGGGDVDLTRHIEQLRAAVDAARQVGTLERDEAARELWHARYSRLSAGRPGMLGAMTARAEAQVMRLACIYALSDSSVFVRRSHLKAALEVWRYCFDSARYLFGDRLGDPTADDILRALREAYPASLTRKDINLQVFHKNKSSSEIARALALLAECRLARSEEDRSGGGRPAERWWFCEQETTN